MEHDDEEVTLLRAVGSRLTAIEARVYQNETEAARLPLVRRVLDDGRDPVQRAAMAAWIGYGAHEKAVELGGIRAAANVGTDPQGGWLVPGFDPVVEKLDKELDPLYADATVETLTEGDHLEYLVSKNNASSGMVSEMGTRTETTIPDLVKVDFPVHAWYAEPHATTRSLQTARNVEEWLLGAIADARFSTLADYYHTGNGVGRPRGILTYPTVATADATRAWGDMQHVVTGFASGFLAPTTSVSPVDCLIDLVASLRTPYRVGAAWYMSRATLATIQKFKDPDGRPIVRDPNLAGEPFSLLGFPIRIDEYMPAVGADAYPIAFGHMKKAYGIAQFPMLMIRDNVTTKGRVKFYTEQLVGGAVKNFEALKLLKVST